MKSLLVIGGSGFFGKSILCAFTRGLLKPYNISNIIIISRHASQLAVNFPMLVNADVSLIDGDISIATELPNADYIIHAAASSDARDYINNPEGSAKNIIACVENFCRILEVHPQKNSKILFVSSGSVYGKQPIGLDKMPETFAPAKSNDDGKKAYARAKICSEKIIQEFANKNGWQVSVARCFAFVGQWLPRDQHFAIGNFLDAALHKRSIVVNAEHPVIRSYMYADDLVEWLITMVQRATKEFSVYNVGSDEAIEIRDLARKIGTIMHVDVQASKLFDKTKTDCYVPRIDKAMNDLGLRLNYNLEDTLRETIKVLGL